MWLKQHFYLNPSYLNMRDYRAVLPAPSEQTRPHQSVLHRKNLHFLQSPSSRSPRKDSLANKPSLSWNWRTGTPPKHWSPWWRNLSRNLNENLNSLPPSRVWSKQVFLRYILLPSIESNSFSSSFVLSSNKFPFEISKNSSMALEKYEMSKKWRLSINAEIGLGPRVANSRSNHVVVVVVVVVLSLLFSLIKSILSEEQMRSETSPADLQRKKKEDGWRTVNDVDRTTETNSISEANDIISFVHCARTCTEKFTAIELGRLRKINTNYRCLRFDASFSVASHSISLSRRAIKKRQIVIVRW